MMVAAIIILSAVLAAMAVFYCLAKAWVDWKSHRRLIAGLGVLCALAPAYMLLFIVDNAPLQRLTFLLGLQSP